MEAGDIDSTFGQYIMRTYDASGHSIRTNDSYELARVKKEGAYVYGLRERPIVGVGTRKRRGFHNTPLKSVDDLFGPIDCSEIANNMTTIESLSLREHGYVKEVEQWQHIYHGAKRKLLFCKGNSDDAVPVGDYWSYPCAYCGLMLPEALIQVDHRQPKENPGVAVMKLIRAVAEYYAGAPSSGQKARQIAKLAAGTQGLTKLRVGKHAFGSAFMSSSKPEIKQKYELTMWGQTFLTVCCMMHKETGWEHICVNNVLNLVPSCALCNGSAGKHGRIHQVPKCY